MSESDANGDNNNNNNNNVRVIQLDARAELRVQVNEAGVVADDGGAGAVGAANSACWFKLISGTAEMFGTELPVVSGVLRGLR